MKWYGFGEKQPYVGEEILVAEDPLAIDFSDFFDDIDEDGPFIIDENVSPEDIRSYSYSHTYVATFLGQKYNEFFDEYDIGLGNFKAYLEKEVFDSEPRYLGMSNLHWARLN